MIRVTCLNVLQLFSNGCRKTKTITPTELLLAQGAGKITRGAIGFGSGFVFHWLKLIGATLLSQSISVAIAIHVVST